MPMLELTKVMARESAAYLQTLLLAPRGKAAVIQNTEREADFGVLFVPGVGANASQFIHLKRALASVSDRFDAFDYALDHPQTLARTLRAHITSATPRARRLLVIGHSLGGILLRLVIQGEEAPTSIAGFVSICAPLQGTMRSRFALSPNLRMFLPDGPLVADLSATRHRLEPLRGKILTIGARHDPFISPYESAILHEHETLLLDDVGHVASLFDARVHAAVRDFAQRVRATHRDR